MPTKEYRKIGPKYKAIQFTGKNGKEVREFVQKFRDDFKFRLGNGWMDIRSLYVGERIKKDTWVLIERVNKTIHTVLDEEFSTEFRRVGAKAHNIYMRYSHWVYAIQFDRNSKDVSHFLRNAGVENVRAGGTWVKAGDRMIQKGEYIWYNPGTGMLGFEDAETFESRWREIKAVKKQEKR